MEKINQFSIQRFILLMKRHLILNYKLWLIGFGAISGLLIIISQFQAYIAGGALSISTLNTLGLIFLVTGGYLVTSMSYNELHNPASSQFLLILPATNTEKLLSHWFVTSILYVLIANAILFLSVLISSLITYAIYNYPIGFLDIFSRQNLKVNGVYLVTQPIFFLGALYFRRYNFLKTLLSGFALFMLIGLWSGLVMWIFFGTGNTHIDIESVSPAMANFMEITLPKIARTIFWYILAPFFLIVSFFTLKEREV